MQRVATVCVVVLMTVLLVSCVTVQKVVVNKYPETPAVELVDGKDVKPFAITRIVSKTNRGEQFGAVQVGLMCVPNIAITWRGSGKYNVSDQEYVQIFLDECKKLNYPVLGDPNSLFETGDKSKALIQVGAMIVDQKINVCLPLAGFGSKNSKGEASVSVEWQIYSVLDKKLLYKVTTNGSAEVKDATPNGADDLQYNAFAQSVRGLLANNSFQKIIRGESGTDDRTSATDRKNDPVEIVVDKKSRRPIGSFKEARKAVFTVFMANGGTGTGFFISPDGYGLTNYHVAQESDKIRCVGEDRKPVIATVLNRDPKRDIALIKAESGTFDYLDIDMNKADVGTDVYAIGSPRGDEYHGSMSRGMISDYRTMNGQLELQSDAITTHGNSGGPLVDARARVLGICAWGRDDAAMLNFYIPIFDGLEKINISVR